MGAQTVLPTQPATTNRSIMMNPHLPIRVFLLSDHRLLRGALARTLKNRADISLVSAQESSLNITAEIVESTCDVLLVGPVNTRSEEHTSELQSRLHLVCRLLLEKKKNKLTSHDLAYHGQRRSCHGRALSSSS